MNKSVWESFRSNITGEEIGNIFYRELRADLHLLTIVGSSKEFNLYYIPSNEKPLEISEVKKLIGEKISYITYKKHKVIGVWTDNEFIVIDIDIQNIDYTNIR